MSPIPMSLTFLWIAIAVTVVLLFAVLFAGLVYEHGLETVLAVVTDPLAKTCRWVANLAGMET